jgi:hypothetical protein
MYVLIKTIPQTNTSNLVLYNYKAENYYFAIIQRPLGFKPFYALEKANLNYKLYQI